MPERAVLDGVRLGSTWRRNPPGREVVRVERLWVWPSEFEEGGPVVRAHPIRGGKPLIAPTDWFRENFTEES